MGTLSEVIGPARFARRIDEFQQRSRPLGFLVGVVKKFGDDRAGMLAALLAYYGFLAIFPLLLLLVTVLGFVLHDNPTLQQRVLESALSDVPVLGNQLRDNIHAIQASPLVTIIAALGLLWGSLGITQAAQYAMAQIWNVAETERPGFVTRLLHGLGFIGALGVGVALSTVLTTVSAFGGNGPVVRVLVIAADVALNIGLYLAAFRILTPAAIASAKLVPGAVLAGIGWTALQFLGTYLVGRQLQHTSELYGVFALVLGLIWWLFLIAQLTMYAAELNVVRARRLWPRALLTSPTSPGAEPEPAARPAPILRQ